ncbi:Lipoprotein-releasing system ATP-binding protein LolD [Cedecea lapagei]|uniref:Lipoprotein-releasing system ATP-binding protein LolD n=1 Tax=Cedecea lapagei TaxID=158823 RepID=A0A447UZ93_9ENTR|nr:Lipoprotein-releasing system ATP-binding protein LolD [Cedecea lapagei]
MPAENIVEVHHLSKSVGQGEHELSILTGVELVVKPAETIALIGESGSGKSTLLAILAGLDDGTDGEVHLCGQPLLLANSANMQQGSVISARQRLRQDGDSVGSNAFARVKQRYGAHRLAGKICAAAWAPEATATIMRARRDFSTH